MSEPMHGRGVLIDEHRRVEGFIPHAGGIQFEFWNGAVRSTIRLSDEAFRAAIDIYNDLQNDRTTGESA